MTHPPSARSLRAHATPDGTPTRHTTLALTLVATILLAATIPLQAATLQVSTAAAFHDAVGRAKTGDHIVLAPGIYKLQRQVEIRTPGITIRGATGKRTDVRFVGSGMNVTGVNEGLAISSNDVSIRDVSFSDFSSYAIHIRGENNADRTVIRNIYSKNVGERHIKGSAGNGHMVDGAVIRNSFMENTIAKTLGNTNYVGGIDIMATNGLVIRENRFRNIKGSSGGGAAAIFNWNGSKNTTIERNVVINADRGIALGNPSNPNNIVHVDGALVANNFITRGKDIGLELAYTRNVQVVNNTIWGSDADFWRAVHLHGSNSGNLSAINNLIRGRIFRNGANWTESNNIIGGAVKTEWFVDPVNGNLRLKQSVANDANGPVDKGRVLTSARYDIDWLLRGSRPDIGGHELRVALMAMAFAIDTVDVDAMTAFSAMMDEEYEMLQAYSGEYDAAELLAWELADRGGLVFDGVGYGAASDIPEPASLMLLGVASGVLLRRRRSTTGA